jgi:glycosyltransferase involved in cell wall biosynthesis
MLSNFGELTPRPAATRASLGVPDDALLLLAMGRFDPWKSFDVLISAMKHLPAKAVLCLAGEGAPMEQFKALAAEEGVADRVRFLGWRDDQAALLGACDLCVVPSFHEPLGNVILEAWSLKAPVVAAASEGPSWLITHGDTGLLCEPRNVTDLAAKIRQALESPTLRESLARNGHEKWATRFSKDVICRQYTDFFEEIRTNRRAPSMPARMTRMIKGFAFQYRSRPSQKEYRSLASLHP